MCVAGGPDRGDLRVRTNYKKKEKEEVGTQPLCFHVMIRIRLYSPSALCSRRRACLAAQLTTLCAPIVFFFLFNGRVPGLPSLNSLPFSLQREEGEKLEAFLPPCAFVNFARQAAIN